MKYVACAIGALIILAAAAPQVHSIDATHSTAEFTVSHIWVEHVTGRVPILSGSVAFVPGSAIPVSVNAVLDATGIATDEPDRDRALKSPDFFDTARFPRWSFTSTKIVPSGPAAFELDGDLTIHGVTQPEKLEVTVSGAPDHPIYRATATIDRHAFGMATTRLDPTIGAEVGVTLDVTLK